MMIEFHCESIIPDSHGNDAVCGNRIIVSDELVGEFVTCSRCRNKVEVPFEKRSAGHLQDSSGKSTSPADGKSGANPKRRLAEKHSRGSAGDDDYRLGAPITRPQSDLSMLDMGDSLSSGHALPKNKRPRCPKCGAVITQRERCSSCGARRQIFESAAKPADDINVGLAGFQLWFVDTVAESIPFRFLATGLHIAVGILTLLMSFAALFGLGGFWGVLLFILIGFCAGMYIAAMIKGYRLTYDPNARLAWYQLPFWYGLLFLARRLNWQDYDQNLKGRKIIDLRGEGITDNTIPKINDIERCQVLDLENTEVTDQGLRHLYNLKNLRCLVLRKTGVSHGGVLQLQQSRRRLWIWY